MRHCAVGVEGREIGAPGAPGAHPIILSAGPQLPGYIPGEGDECGSTQIPQLWVAAGWPHPMGPVNTTISKLCYAVKIGGKLCIRQSTKSLSDNSTLQNFSIFHFNAH